MLFLGISSPLITIQKKKKDEDYYKGPISLKKFSITLVLTVVLDYMRNICLQVMKRLLIFWIKTYKV